MAQGSDDGSEPPARVHFDPVVAIEIWLASWKLIIIGGLLVGVCAVAASFAVKPVFRATILVAPAANDSAGQLGALRSEFGGLAQLAGINLGGGADQKVEALATLESDAFLRDFITDNNLMPVLFESKWDPQAGAWRNEPKAPTLADGVEKFKKKIRKVNEDRKTGLVTVRIDWTDRELAAKWANGMIRHLNEFMRRDAVASAEKTIGFLEREIASNDNVELRAALYRGVETQIHRKALATVQEEFVYRIIDPAIIPDPDRRIFPRRSVFGIVGSVMGAILIMTALLWRHRRRIFASGSA